MEFESSPWSRILQKKGELEGWTLPEKEEGFDDAGDLTARFPTRIRTKGHGSMLYE